MKEDNPLELFREYAINSQCEFDEGKFETLSNKRPLRSALLMLLVWFATTLGTGFFMAFLDQILDDAIYSFLLIFGVISMVVAYFLSTKMTSITLEGLSVAFFANGFIAIQIGLHNAFDTAAGYIENRIALLAIGISIFSLIIYRLRSIIFLSALTLIVALHVLLAINGLEPLVTFLYLMVFLGLMLCNLFETKIRLISFRVSEMFIPIRTVLFGYVLVLSIIGSTITWRVIFITTLFEYILVKAAVIFAIGIVLHKLFKQIEITSIYVQVGVYILIAALVWYLYLGWSIGLLFMLCAFGMRNYKEFGLSVCVFIWAIGLFYYDLNTSLLYKSLLMMIVGIVFFGLFILAKKGGKLNEVE